MRLTNLKTCRITNPLGFHIDKPLFTWVVEDTTSKKQVSARVEISTSPVFTDLCYDSGEREDISGSGFTAEIELSPRTRYFWRVTVKGDAGDSATESAWFETSKMDELWEAKWITPDMEDTNIHPYLRKSFIIGNEVESARIYATGLGIYTMEINGRRVGTEYLTPAFNSYDMWTQYQTYDVTELLTAGENVVGAMLGNGWAKGRFGFDYETYCLYIDRFCFICELRIKLKDGSEMVFGTDDTWKSFASPVLNSNIYDGETFDANRIEAGWSTPGYDCSNWQGTVLYDYDLGKLMARKSLPVLVKQVLRPKEIITTPAGETVIDVGQNIVGWLRFRVDVPKGTKISLYHGEILQNDNFYRDNLRTAKAEYHYISSGVSAEVEPYFTFYGFRYVKVEGWIGDISLDDFDACVVYSDLDETGKIETSNPLVNRLFLNALWSQRDNFLDVPTDCPQRDERMGWTGDAQVFSGTASFNMDTYAFFDKFMYDTYMEQLKYDGRVPNVVPDVISRRPQQYPSGGACAWADAATVIPWNLYLFYGDKSALERQFDSMKAWVDWVTKQGVDVKTGGGWLSSFHFGDWLALDGPSPLSPMGGTEVAFLAAAYYVYSSMLVSKAAEVLGKVELAKNYREISNRVRSEMRDEYFTPNGRGALDTQTFYVVSLFMDIVPDEHRERLFEAFKTRLAKDDYHLKTGFIGTPLLCRVLSDNGAPDLAYRLLLNEDLPSWLYEVKMGATTIWERWNSVNPDGSISDTGMNSLNHYAYGSVVEWMYRNMCGLQPCEDAPGFRRVLIKPEPDKRFRYAKAEYLSASGLYRSAWQISDSGELIFDVTVPFNAEAELILPNAIASNIKGAEGLVVEQIVEQDVNYSVRIHLLAGSYTFSYLPEKNYLQRPLGLNSKLSDLIDIPQARDILREIPNFRMIERAAGDLLKDSTLSDLIDNPSAKQYLGDVDWVSIEEKLSQIIA
ncbi:MAG: family 78 glycoside hydrolase catalytic domain [Eubacteriales bacterium]|jgi:alpha-L-rhamnosidase